MNEYLPDSQPSKQPYESLTHKTGEIDFLISDMKMPGMDGLELTDQLELRRKALNLARQMKSIALTGYPKEYSDSDSAVYSFDEYMEKSGDFDAVLRVVRELPNS